eukprot:COSAG04_NODE_13293_length_612_cov_1.239766_1_plen_42_part_10
MASERRVTLRPAAASGGPDRTGGGTTFRAGPPCPGARGPPAL